MKLPVVRISPKHEDIFVETVYHGYEIKPNGKFVFRAEEYYVVINEWNPGVAMPTVANLTMRVEIAEKLWRIADVQLAPENIHYRFVMDSETAALVGEKKEGALTHDYLTFQVLHKHLQRSGNLKPAIPGRWVEITAPLTDWKLPDVEEFSKTDSTVVHHLSRSQLERVGMTGFFLAPRVYDLLAPYLNPEFFEIIHI